MADGASASRVEGRDEPEQQLHLECIHLGGVVSTVVRRRPLGHLVEGDVLQRAQVGGLVACARVVVLVDRALYGGVELLDAGVRLAREVGAVARVCGHPDDGRRAEALGEHLEVGVDRGAHVGWLEVHPDAPAHDDELRRAIRVEHARVLGAGPVHAHPAGGDVDGLAHATVDKLELDVASAIAHPRALDAVQLAFRVSREVVPAMCIRLGGSRN
mmetsp:Transcript_43715/g.92980  ORF Transcript_43715/g.92980 Transcript_43715/m.92980 type:complete len:215 (+) Transcript_43715:459-1103(+)